LTPKICFMSESVDNYIKAIYSLSLAGDKGISTSAIAERMHTKASSATDMLKKLDERGLVKHTKYYGVTLTSKGRKMAVDIVRKHRLWEVFLSEKLGLSWDKIHDIAEELEHVHSDELIDKLDKYLGYPGFDPHGDPIPDKNGLITDHRNAISADQLKEGQHASIVGVEESSSAFLQYLDSVKLRPGISFEVLKYFEYDSSMQIKTDKDKLSISHLVAKNLKVTKLKK
jgi:DtxR family transcriptional regulator, Mn-dependent transcriptional regulator